MVKSSAPAPPKRIGWLDVARGLTIILVVIGHVERGLVSAKIAQGPIWTWMDYTIYTIHMPAFFLFSGITASMSLRRKAPPAFIKEKLWTIAYPYFLWSLIQGFVMYGLSALTNSKESLHGLVSIGWQPIGQFWFLYALMICQIFGALLFRYRILFLLLAACLYIPETFRLPQNILENTGHFMIFYTIGFFDLSGIVLFLRERRKTLEVLLPVLFIVATYLSGIADHTNYYSILSLPSTLFGVGFILTFSQSTHAKWTKGLIALGAASMTIYVLHILFAAGIRILWHKLHLPGDVCLILGVCSSIGVVGPYIVHQALERLHLLAPLGLASFRRTAAV